MTSFPIATKNDILPLKTYETREVTIMRTAESIVLWNKRIADREQSGLKVGDWCDKNNISRHAYYYWHRKVQGVDFQDVKENIFAEVSIASDPETLDKKEAVNELTIAWNDFSIRITDSNSIPLMVELMNRLVKQC